MESVVGPFDYQHVCLHDGHHYHVRVIALVFSGPDDLDLRIVGALQKKSCYVFCHAWMLAKNCAMRLRRSALVSFVWESVSGKHRRVKQISDDFRRASHHNARGHLGVVEGSEIVIWRNNGRVVLVVKTYPSLDQYLVAEVVSGSEMCKSRTFVVAASRVSWAQDADHCQKECRYRSGEAGRGIRLAWDFYAAEAVIEKSPADVHSHDQAVPYHSCLFLDHPGRPALVGEC